MSESESERRRRRWVTLGELIALAALIVSGFGVWISWRAATLMKGRLESSSSASRSR